MRAVFDLTNRKEFRSFFGHAASITSLAYSPDGKLLAAGNARGAVQVWETGAGQQIRLYRHAWAIGGVAFSPDGHRLIVGSGGSRHSECVVWDLALNQEFHELQGHSKALWTIAFSPSGRRLASASDDNTVSIWDVENKKNLLSLAGHKGPVYGVTFSPDNTMVATAGDDRNVVLWDSVTGARIRTLTGHKSWAHTVAFHPSRERLASASGDGTIRVWDTTNGEQVLRIDVFTTNAPGGKFPTNPFVTTVVFSPDGKRIAAGGYNSVLEVWDSEDGRKVLTLDQKGVVYSVAFSRDGKRVASSAGEVKIWDAHSGRELLELKGFPASGVRSVAFSPDGERIVTSSGGNVKLWDAFTGEEILTLEGGSNVVAFSPDGLLIAVAGPDGSIRRWDGGPSKAVEARREELRTLVSERDSSAPATLIDLSQHYNAGLTETWHLNGSDLSALPTGIQNLSTIPFDIRGLMQVGAQPRKGKPYPLEVSGIGVGFACRQLHFLHAAIPAAGIKDGTEIGRYVVQYADGQTNAIPIVVGRDVADWWNQPKEENKSFVIAWAGTNESSRAQKRNIRLFKSTWKNPISATVVKSIDFVSTHDGAQPFLVAITAE